MNNRNDVLDIESLLYEANYYRREGEYSEAIISYKEIINIIKKNDMLSCKYGPLVFRQLSYCFRKSENIIKALYYAEKAVFLARQNCYNSSGDDKLIKELAICLMNLGSIYDSKQNYDSAILCYVEASSLFEKITDNTDLLLNAMVNLGTAYYNIGSNKKAISCFTRILVLTRNNLYDVRANYANYYLNILKEN